jgi:toxin ParE1/3/4
MSKPWRLTRAAETSLINIARWTVETFGPRQADACDEDLIATCRDIAADPALSQECRRLIDPDMARVCVFRAAGSISPCLSGTRIR